MSKLKNFIITEDELFSQENNPRSFLLLKGIIEHKLLNKFSFEEIKKLKYIDCSLKNKENILKKLKNGEIKYNLFKNIDFHSEKIEENINKLNILLFDNKEEVEECMTILYSGVYLSSISIHEPTVNATEAQYTGSSTTSLPSLIHQS